MSGMKAQILRTVIISLTDLVAVHTALDLLQSGSGLTAVQSGVDDEDPIGNLTLIGEPRVLFDGFKYTVFLFVTTG